jgi:DNA-directed RNA polymerase specialized sigma24 family protein
VHDVDPTSKLDAAEADRIFREPSGRSAATLIPVFGDIDVAEDAVQDAFAVALRSARRGSATASGLAYAAARAAVRAKRARWALAADGEDTVGLAQPHGFAQVQGSPRPLPSLAADPDWARIQAQLGQRALSRTTPMRRSRRFVCCTSVAHLSKVPICWRPSRRAAAAPQTDRPTGC